MKKIANAISEDESLAALASQRFTFDEDKHMYYLDGKPLSGVTSVLRVVAKPNLIQWAATEACKSVEQKLEELEKSEVTNMVYFFSNLRSHLKIAKTAHATKRDKAADAGTDVHASLENLIKAAIEFNGGLLYDMQGIETNNEQVAKFVQWAVQKKVKFLSSERQMYSEKMWLAGTCDFVCEIDGKRYVGDIKTSSGIWHEAFLQMAAYRMMIEEMGEKVEGTIVVRLGKDGSFETKEHVGENASDRDGFLGALQLYRSVQAWEAANPRKY